MTVEELITRLTTMPLTAEVIACCIDGAPVVEVVLVAKEQVMLA